MKRNLFTKCIAVMLGMIMLTNCTVYKGVEQSVTKVNLDKEIVLYKDDLVFYLNGIAVRNDTIFAELSDGMNAPCNSSRMDIYLIPQQVLAQDSGGILAIPFASVDHIQQYVKDVQKSRRATLLFVGGSMAVVGIIFSAIFIKAWNESWEEILEHKERI